MGTRVKTATLPRGWAGSGPTVTGQDARLPPRQSPKESRASLSGVIPGPTGPKSQDTKGSGANADTGSWTRPPLHLIDPRRRRTHRRSSKDSSLGWKYAPRSPSAPWPRTPRVVHIRPVSGTRASVWRGRPRHRRDFSVLSSRPD